MFPVSRSHLEEYVSRSHPDFGSPMTTLVRISLIILCALADYSRCQQILEHAVHIGDNCERDAECIENAFCRWQQNCLCNPYYSPTPDKSMCIATVGLSCEDDTACQTMANGECKQGTCACKDNFFLDSNNKSNCIPRPIKIGDRCQITTVCQDSFNYAICINNQCQCILGYHFVNETRVCILNQDLYTTCSKDYDCYVDDKYPDILECKNGQCVCKEGERCAKGSLLTAAGTIVTILLLLQGIVQ